jgi:uncharacterized protein YkwD
MRHLMVRRQFGLVLTFIAIAALVQYMNEPRGAGKAYANVGCGPVQAEHIADATARTMILCLLNHERTKRDLPPLRENALLTQASNDHSEDMVERKFFAHDNPDGVAPAQRIEATGYAPSVPGLVGENIAWGEGPLGRPGAIVDAWMHSPGHKRAILEPRFREVGLGIARGNVQKRRPPGRSAAAYTTDFGG